MVTLSPFDLEVLRLGNYGSLRILRDAYGKFLHYFVVGQRNERPKLEASVRKLVDMNLLAEEPGMIRVIEGKIVMTESGRRIYRQFEDMEEKGLIRHGKRGSLQKDGEKLASDKNHAG